MIKAQNLTRRFGPFAAVVGLSLDVPAGSVLALLGSNGAGKTTTVRMLAGLIAPSEGEATVAGYNIQTQAQAVRTSIGLMTDTPGLYEQMTTESYLDFFGKIYGMPQKQRALRISELLELFQLQEQRQKKMAGFSKGMKQKVALARALLHDPAVLFLDEPTSGLDPLSARTVRELMLRLKHSSRSIILCTHDLDEAERVADRVAIMRRGRIVACDTPARLRALASGETKVSIELATPCPEALAILRSVPEVIDPAFTFEPANQQENPLLITWRTVQPELTNPRILAKLVQAGAQVIAIVNETSSLEDVYISAMNEEKSAEKNARQIRETATMPGEN